MDHKNYLINKDTPIKDAMKKIDSLKPKILSYRQQGPLLDKWLEKRIEKILPQVMKIIMPSITNEVITLVKDTSLAFTLAYQEVFSLAKQISASQTSFMPFLIAGVFYFVANYVVERVMARIERSMDYYK